MNGSTRDTIFNVDTIEEDFVFNQRVVEVFDDMIDRSVPFYRQVIESSAELLNRFTIDDDIVYDLGCSTGSSLLECARILGDRNLQFVGIDNSAPMLEKASLKAELHGKKDVVSFALEDITEFSHAGAGAIILNYTLQFIRPIQREDFLKRLYDNLRPGKGGAINHRFLRRRHYLCAPRGNRLSRFIASFTIQGDNLATILDNEIDQLIGKCPIMHEADKALRNTLAL